MAIDRKSYGCFGRDHDPKHTAPNKSTAPVLYLAITFTPLVVLPITRAIHPCTCPNRPIAISGFSFILFYFLNYPTIPSSLPVPLGHCVAILFPAIVHHLDRACLFVYFFFHSLSTTPDVSCHPHYLPDRVACHVIASSIRTPHSNLTHRLYPPLYPSPSPSERKGKNRKEVPTISHTQNK
ncbi:MAG: hypothetical protein JOS17DRAFT_431888 [Linnemannia elongata]|nr:MAG: hypothetical protein JOS17DRAFT_431888 [Linnemannia elongata]